MPKKSMLVVKKGKVRAARKGTPRLPPRESKRSSIAPRRPKRMTPGVGLSSSASSTSRVMTSAIPANIGASMPRSFFGFAGRAQALADQDADSSLRIRGRDLYFQPIQSGSVTAAAGFGGTATYYATVSPRNLSLRLENIEEVFSFYVIRACRVFYAPATGSTSTVQVALGYTPSPYTVSGAIPSPTQTQVLELPSAALFPAWQPAVLEFKMAGTKVYLTSTAGAGTIPPDIVQGFLACTLLNAVATTVYGQLWLEYVVDFYSPSPVLIDPIVEHKSDVLGRNVVSTGISFTKTLRATLRGDPPPETKIPVRSSVPDSKSPFTPGGPPPTDPDAHPPVYSGFRGGRWVVDPIDDGVVVSASSTPTAPSGSVKVPSTKK
jgi:hypothetical protein